MSSIEERKKNRLQKIINLALKINPTYGMAEKASKLLAGVLTPKKEDVLESIISDLKLGAGDRGAAEAIPKKKIDESVNFTKKIRNINKNIKPAKMPQIQNDPRDDYPRDDYPQFLAKGGKVKSKKTKNKTTKKKTNDARAIAKKYFKGTF